MQPDFWLGLALGALLMVLIFALNRPSPQPRDEHGRFVKRRAF